MIHAMFHSQEILLTDLLLTKKALEFLKKFEFSSFPDRMGERDNKILAPKKVLERHAFQSSSEKGKAEFREFVEEFLKERSKYSNFE